MDTDTRQKGFVLILILWVIIIVSVMAFDFASNMKLEARITLNLVEQTKAYFLARSGFDLGVAEIQRRLNYVKKNKGTLSEEQEEEYVLWAFDGSENTVEFNDDAIQVRVIAEESKIDLNKTNVRVLRGLLREMGLEKEDEDIIVDSIQDWKDGDNNHRLNGAEKDYYNKMDPPYEPRNAAFDSVEELLLVRGVSEELLYASFEALDENEETDDEESSQEGEEEKGAPLRFIDCLTVNSSDGKINLNYAPEEVLRAIPFLKEGAVGRIMDLRRDRGSEFIQASDYQTALGDEIYNAIGPYVSYSQSAVTFSVLSKGELAGGAFEMVKVLVKVKSGNPKKPYEIIQWLDSAM